MDKNTQKSNRLINQTSRYLLQHANNPVDWYPWGEEAFEKARDEKKLVLISIGYSSCHWCHVMEKEAFTDLEVARVMNEHFVNIKVDREERPDVDHIYMDAVQILTGSGGWPLNCFALPDGKPVYGGTYFPKSQWLEVLTSLATTYRNEPEKVIDQAEKISQGVSELQFSILGRENTNEFREDKLKNYISSIKKDLDPNYGGTKGAPKFPLPALHQTLLKYHFYSKEEETQNYLLLTLKNMASGGIYDHLEGGFARYSTDKEWKVPHFEKMLYDNAQLASLYSQSYLLYKDENLKETAIDILNFLKDQMLSSQNLFFSSFDADSEGKEGEYYTWLKQEFEDIFLRDSSLLMDYFGITKEGDVDGKNVLRIDKSIDALSKTYSIPEERISQVISEGKQQLLQKRKKRNAPELDNKVIVSWNALAIKAFINGYRATQKREFLRIALESAESLVSHQLQKDYRLNRIYSEGDSSVNGFLDDYAFLTDTLIQLYQVTFDAKWIDWAMKITEYVMKHFQSSNSNLFQYTSNLDESLIAPKMEIMDSVLPSSNAVMAKNLFILGQFFYSDAYINQARKMLGEVEPVIHRNPIYFGHWIDLMVWFVFPPYEISIVGRKAEEYKERFMHLYHPGIILAGGTHEGNIPILRNRFKLGQTQIYICQGRVCKKPFKNVDEALKMIS